MSVTTPTNVDTSISEVWAKLVLADHLRSGFWGRFVGGEGSGMPIIQKTELLNKSGDLIHIQTTSPLSGAGVSGDTAALEGNEENLTTSEIKVSPTLYRHAVRNNRRAVKKSILDLNQEARMRLAEWGMDKMDTMRFSQFVSASAGDVPDASYTPNLYAVGTGTAGTKADVETANKLTVSEIRKIRYVLEANKCLPFKVNGLPFWAMVVSPEVAFDLKGDTTYDDYVTTAASRGMDNPVFTGALANIDGIVLYSDFRVPTASDGGAGTNVRYAKCLAFGRESFVEGVDETVSWAEDTFDYGLERGVAYSFAFQPRRALEQNSLQVLAAAAVPA